MRIIAGIHRGRVITPTNGKEVRPTTGRTREALFSILTSGQFLQDGKSILDGAVVADICCGTGALGLEALSRGAAQVIFIDKDADHLQAVQASANAYGEAANINVIRTDVTFLPYARVPCNVIFLDPPYHKDLLPAALKGLLTRGWLAEGAVVVAEMGKREPFDVPEGLTLLDERIYGKTRVLILTPLQPV